MACDNFYVCTWLYVLFNYYRLLFTKLPLDRKKEQQKNKEYYRKYGQKSDNNGDNNYIRQKNQQRLANYC